MKKLAATVNTGMESSGNGQIAIFTMPRAVSAQPVAAASPASAYRATFLILASVQKVVLNESGCMDLADGGVLEV